MFFDGLFSFIFVFSSKHYFFATNKCASNIRCWDSHPQPSEHECWRNFFGFKINTTTFYLGRSSLHLLQLKCSMAEDVTYNTARPLYPSLTQFKIAAKALERNFSLHFATPTTTPTTTTPTKKNSQYFRCQFGLDF